MASGDYGEYNHKLVVAVNNEKCNNWNHELVANGKASFGEELCIPSEGCSNVDTCAEDPNDPKATPSSIASCHTSLLLDNERVKFILIYFIFWNTMLSNLFNKTS